jgi:hypothetical protein
MVLPGQRYREPFFARLSSKYFRTAEAAIS